MRMKGWVTVHRSCLNGDGSPMGWFSTTPLSPTDDSDVFEFELELPDRFEKLKVTSFEMVQEKTP